MNEKLKVILLILAIFNSSCNHPDKRLLNDKKDSINRDEKLMAKQHNKGFYKMNFFDSILAKSGLTLDQVRKHITGNSFYIQPETDSIYVAPYSRFSGDTIYDVNSNYSVAIIHYAGLNCSESFLLVYKRGYLKNTDCKLVAQDCDDDGDDQGHNTLTFKILNSTVFYTIDTDYKAKTNTHPVITNQFYRIKKDGKIESLHKNPLIKGSDML